MAASDYVHCSGTKCEKKELVRAGGVQNRENKAENKQFLFSEKGQGE